MSHEPPCEDCRLAWDHPVEYAARHDLPNPNHELGMKTQQRIWRLASRHCGHPMTWELASIPPAPHVPDDWPLCGCGSGLLATTWYAPTPDGAPELISSPCCTLRTLNPDHPKRRNGPLSGLSAEWGDALRALFGGYPAIHAINRGETPLPAWPHQANEPTLF